MSGEDPYRPGRWQDGAHRRGDRERGERGRGDQGGGGGTFDALKEADKQSWWDQVEPANERAAELAAQSAASGVPVGQQQMPVESGVVNPIQFGPSIAQNIPGGQIQLGGTYVADRPAQAGGGIVTTGEPPSTTHAIAPPPQITDRSQLQESSPASATVTATLEVNRILEEVQRERAMLAGERLLEARLRETMLPAAALARVRGRFAGQVATEAGITTAVKEETDYLGAIAQAGSITGLGYERSYQVGLTEAEKLQKAFDSSSTSRKARRCRRCRAFARRMW